VWTALDPQSKLLVVVEVGNRTLALAQRVVHQVTEGLAPGGVPLLLTDGLKDYTTALLTHFGQWMHPERRQERGPMPKPRWIPLPALLYAQVVQSYRRRRLVGVTHRGVFGTRLAIAQILAPWGWTINTAFVERLNLDLRQRVAAIGRRVNTLCQGEAGLRDQLGLCQVYHNFVLPHTSLRQALDEPIPPHKMGSARLWRPYTPAMAAGLTDHIWSLKEVLFYRVPPWPQPQTVGGTVTLDDRGRKRLRCTQRQTSWVRRRVENGFESGYRLSDTTQPARDGSGIFIRSQQVRDRSLAQQQHVGLPLEHVPSRTREATLDERDDIMVCHGPRRLAMYMGWPDGVPRLQRWPTQLTRRASGSPPRCRLVARGHASRVPFLGASPSMV
jgi:hypothetical protein